MTELQQSKERLPCDLFSKDENNEISIHMGAFFPIFLKNIIDIHNAINVNKKTEEKIKTIELIEETMKTIGNYSFNFF